MKKAFCVILAFLMMLIFAVAALAGDAAVGEITSGGLPDWLSNPATWVATVSLLVAILNIVAPITKTKLDDRVLAFIKDTVQPVVEERAAAVAAETVKQVAANKLKEPETGSESEADA